MGNIKLCWSYYGPYRIVVLNDVSALLRRVNDPSGESNWVPLDRVMPLPKELLDFAFASNRYQKKIFLVGTKQLMRSMAVTCGLANAILYTSRKRRKCRDIMGCVGGKGDVIPRQLGRRALRIQSIGLQQ